MTAVAIGSAFQDAPHESQAVFRTVMQAMSRPGQIRKLNVAFEPPAPLTAAAAAIILTLTDFETPIWLDKRLCEDSPPAEFLRFHTGVKVVSAAADAQFAVIADPLRAPPLAAFSQGTPDYPDRSATLIIQVDELNDHGWRLAGPGIREEIAFSAAPLPNGYFQQLRENAARFPLGIDVIFAGQNEIAALPRSTRILEAG